LRAIHTPNSARISTISVGELFKGVADKNKARTFFAYFSCLFLFAKEKKTFF